jgi:hypothetical protein
LRFLFATVSSNDLSRISTFNNHRGGKRLPWLTKGVNDFAGIPTFRPVANRGPGRLLDANLKEKKGGRQETVDYCGAQAGRKAASRCPPAPARRPRLAYGAASVQRATANKLWLEAGTLRSRRFYYADTKITA